MDLKTRISDIIIKIIEKENLSNLKMSNDLGVDKNTIDNYRRKVSLPNVEFFSRLCKKYNVNPLWVMFGEGERYINKEAGPVPAVAPPDTDPDEFKIIDENKIKAGQINKILNAYIKTTNMLFEKDGDIKDFKKRVETLENEIRNQRINIMGLLQENTPPDGIEKRDITPKLEKMSLK